jgi:carotenoid cleavage dioxygenase-like enzyme
MLIVDFYLKFQFICLEKTCFRSILYAKFSTYQKADQYRRSNIALMIQIPERHSTILAMATNKVIKQQIFKYLSHFPMLNPNFFAITNSNRYFYKRVCWSKYFIHLCCYQYQIFSSIFTGNLLDNIF